MSNERSKYIAVSSQEESKRVQKRLFEMGYCWFSGETVNLAPVNSYNTKTCLIFKDDYLSYADIEYCEEHNLIKTTIDELTNEADSSLDTQVGGSHYKDMAIQPIVFTHMNKLNFCQGNIIKYATRYKNKNGKEDLEKVIHYAQLLIELEYGDNSDQ